MTNSALVESTTDIPVSALLLATVVVMAAMLPLFGLVALFSVDAALAGFLGVGLIAIAHALALLRLKLYYRQVDNADLPTQSRSESSDHEARAVIAKTQTKFFLKAYRRAELLKLCVVAAGLCLLIAINKQTQYQLLMSALFIALVVGQIVFTLVNAIVLARFTSKRASNRASKIASKRALS